MSEFFCKKMTTLGVDLNNFDEKLFQTITRIMTIPKLQIKIIYNNYNYNNNSYLLYLPAACRH